MTIQHGDQYTIPFKIKQGDTILTPSSCEDVKIKIGKITKTYSDNQITYDSTNKTWNFPVTQEQTRSFAAYGTRFQVGIKFIGDEIIYSPVTELDIKSSLITEDWE